MTNIPKQSGSERGSELYSSVRNPSAKNAWPTSKKWKMKDANSVSNETVTYISDWVIPIRSSLVHIFGLRS